MDEAVGIDKIKINKRYLIKHPITLGEEIKSEDSPVYKLELPGDLSARKIVPGQIRPPKLTPEKLKPSEKISEKLISPGMFFFYHYYYIFLTFL